jgi:hypothetical protein
VEMLGFGVDAGHHPAPGATAGASGRCGALTACASCTAGGPPSSVAVRADLWIWGLMYSGVPHRSIRARCGWAPQLAPPAGATPSEGVRRVTSVLFTGGWTIAWRQLHGRHPIVAELAQRVPLLAIWLILVVTGGYPSWSLAVLVVAMLAAVWWAYRPNGRGTRLLEANRMNPRRGFEWVTNQSADTTDDSVAS